MAMDRPRYGWHCATASLALTAAAAFLHTATLVDGDYRRAAFLSISFSSAALGLTAVGWPAMPKGLRVFAALVVGLAILILVDAACSRLPRLMGWW